MAFPLATKKGSRIHVRLGWIYTFAMIILAVAALALTPWRMFIDPARSTNSQSFGLFLTFITLLSVNSVWFGIRAVRTKARKLPDLSLTNLALPLILALAGIVTVAVGISINSNLLKFFPLLGFATVWTDIKFWKNPPESKWAWWYAHMDGMFTACIATTTAFLVTAVPRLFSVSPSQSVFLWFLPTAIGIPTLGVWKRYYKRKLR